MLIRFVQFINFREREQDLDLCLSRRLDVENYSLLSSYAINEAKMGSRTASRKGLIDMLSLCEPLRIASQPRSIGHARIDVKLRARTERERWSSLPSETGVCNE